MVVKLPAKLEALGGVGAKTEARYEGEGDEWYPGTIAHINAEEGTADIDYDDDGVNEKGAVQADNIRARCS
eukprot:g4402.t1